MYVKSVRTHACIHKGQDMGWIVGLRLSTVTETIGWTVQELRRAGRI